ncbi:MAG: hypothetical protein JOZ99_13605 [Actinobacteria bacterium]|nr:hypothetical protein [Actinomycetota bacterium]
MPYLTALRSRGVTLDQMYGASHLSLTNYIAMTSGNGPNASTSGDCLQYDCVFTPPNDTNIGDQLEATGRTRKAYLESMPQPCTHPTVSGSLDPYLVGYATRHNPFVYYQDVVGTDLGAKPARCVEHDVPFSQMSDDLARGTVPNYSLVVPDTCDDAHDGGAQCGLSTADRWLSTNLPPILASSAYRNNGAVIITFDESDVGDRTGCCGAVPGGGHIFTLVLSPRVTPGADTSVPYNHYSLLRTVEEAFDVPCLRHACDPGVAPFGRDVWGRGRVVTTRYTAGDAQSMSTVAQHFGTFPLAQKRAVYALAWITAAAGGLDRTRVSPPPEMTGSVVETSGWGPGELATLRSVERHYRLSAEQVQKFAVQFWARVFAGHS